MQHRKITILLILIGILYSTSSNAQIDSVTDNSQKVTVLEPPIFEFPGGSDSLYKFIDKNLNLTFKRMTVVGSVFVKFTVQKDGSITDIKVAKGLCPKCDKAAVEVIQRMPNWVLINKEKEPISQEIIIPIRFDELE